MDEVLQFAARALAIGVGATATMDVWAVLLRRLFHARSLDYALLGRWLGHLPRGRFIHDSIARAEPIRGEAILGWSAHYAIGVLFAGALLALWGMDWAHRPTLTPALIVGLGTLVAPFLILQPGMGLGLAARRAPNPHVARLRSLATHTIFGFGLYLWAWATAAILDR